MDKITNWTFLNEPAWRWFIFLGVLIAFSVAWKGVLNAIKG